MSLLLNIKRNTFSKMGRNPSTFLFGFTESHRMPLLIANIKTSLLVILFHSDFCENKSRSVSGCEGRRSGRGSKHSLTPFREDERLERLLNVRDGEPALTEA